MMRLEQENDGFFCTAITQMCNYTIKDNLGSGLVLQKTRDFYITMSHMTSKMYEFLDIVKIPTDCM